MPDLEERIFFNKMSKRYFSGELLPGIKFRHNSKIKATLHTEPSFVGWIVGVAPDAQEPIYCIEREDRKPDTEVSESNIELIFDPHES